MKPYILTITLNPAVDKTLSVPGFRTGRDFREQALFLSAGGKGINVSQVLKHLKVPSLASGFLGGPSGDYIRAELDKERIRHDFCPVKGNSRTSLTLIDPRSSRLTRIIERGPQISKKELALFKKKFLKLLRCCSSAVFSGRNIPGAPDSLYCQLIREAKKKGVLTVLDTSGRPCGLGLKAKPFMIKPNLKEAEKILGRRLDSFKKIRQASCLLHKRGIEIVAITMGSWGAVVSNGKELFLGIPPKIKRLSPVGCGDAFIAGFIAYYINRKSFAESIKMAVACGAANALSFKPGSIEPGSIEKMFKRVKIKKAGSGKELAPIPRPF